MLELLGSLRASMLSSRDRDALLPCDSDRAPDDDCCRTRRVNSLGYITRLPVAHNVCTTRVRSRLGV